MVYSTNILLGIVTILTAVFIWSRRTYVYWQRRRVKFVQPTHLLGNLKKVLKLEESFALQLRRFYFDERFRNEPVVGIYLFHQPALLIRDLRLVRTVLVEDFVSFSNRFAKCDMRHDRMGSLNLFFARQPEWREIRTRLSPVFTGAKIKQMFSLMEEVSQQQTAEQSNYTAQQNCRLHFHMQMYDSGKSFAICMWKQISNISDCFVFLYFILLVFTVFGWPV